jgi:hypothetical protein
LKGQASKVAAKAMRPLGTDQSYTKELMLYLGKSLAMRYGLSLLLGAKDPEIAATYTNSGDKLFVLDKAMHLHEALCVLVNKTEENKSISWLWCCELLAESNCNQYNILPLEDYPDLQSCHSWKTKASWSSSNLGLVQI